MRRAHSCPSPRILAARVADPWVPTGIRAEGGERIYLLIPPIAQIQTGPGLVLGVAGLNHGLCEGAGTWRGLRVQMRADVRIGGSRRRGPAHEGARASCRA